MDSDLATIIGLGGGLGVLGIAIWLASAQHLRQKKIQEQYVMSLVSAQRANERVERQIELLERQIKLLERIAQHQDDTVELLRQLAGARHVLSENIQQRG